MTADFTVLVGPRLGEPGIIQSPGSQLDACDRCEHPIWLGPTQLIFRPDFAALCGQCALEVANGAEEKLQALEANLSLTKKVNS